MTFFDFMQTILAHGLDHDGFTSLLTSIAQKHRRQIKKYSSIYDDDDIGQEAFLKVVQAVENDKLDPEHPDLLHLLEIIVKQAAVDLHRKQRAVRRGGRSKRIPFVEGLVVHEASGVSEEDLHDFLRANLNQEELELVFLMAEKNRLHQIAVHFGVSRSEAGRKAMALRAKLRRLFPGDFKDPPESGNSSPFADV